MAAPSRRAAASTDDNDTFDDKQDATEELDFCSPKFNPSLALKAENISVPAPDILTYDSLSSYEEAATRRRLRRESKSNEDSDKSGAKGKRIEDASRRSNPRTRSTSSSRPNSSKGGAEASKDTMESTADKSKRRSRTTDFKRRSSSEFDKPRSRNRSDVQTEMGESSGVHRKRQSCTSEKAGTSGVKMLDLYQRQRVHEKEATAQRLSGTVAVRNEEIAPTSAPPRGRKKKEMRNVFTRMEAVTGPLTLLMRCVKDKEHVRVVTRGAVRVNSICRGYIVAFDKYFNMAMIDVDEIYRRPAALGKVRARASHKLAAAQETLNKERDKYQERWKTKTGKENMPAPLSTPITKAEQNTTTKLGQSVASPSEHSCVKGSVDEPLLTGSKAKPLQSVYSNLPAPLSPYEREALMLGIADENVEHRHINQMLLRGENVVSISIIDDF